MPFINKETEVPYLNPTNTKVFVQDIWLDDVVSISYSTEATRTPYFGFKSTEFDAIGYGPSIVSGTLVCHYRYPVYLKRVIQGVSAQPVQQSQASASRNFGNGHKVIQDANALTFKRPAEWGAALGTMLNDIAQSSRRQEDFKKLSEQLKRASESATDYLGGDDQTLTDTQYLLDKPIDLIVWFGRTDNKYVISSKETIKGVYFTGEQKTISVLDGAGDQSLYEVVSFIAKKVILS